MAYESPLKKAFEAINAAERRRREERMEIFTRLGKIPMDSPPVKPQKAQSERPSINRAMHDAAIVQVRDHDEQMALQRETRDAVAGLVRLAVSAEESARATARWRMFERVLLLVFAAVAAGASLIAVLLA